MKYDLIGIGYSSFEPIGDFPEVLINGKKYIYDADRQSQKDVTLGTPVHGYANSWGECHIPLKPSE